MKIIFLDVDGVLNGYNKFTEIIYSVFVKLHMIKFIRKHYDLFGIRTSMVRHLSSIVRKTDAKVVLSSSWRYGWFKAYDPKDSRQGALHKKLNNFNIEVIDITPKIESQNRGEEIQMWLSEHDEIESFVILDDEICDIKDLYNDRLVQTSDSECIRGNWYENTGLKRNHVKKAVKILNTK